MNFDATGQVSNAGNNTFALIQTWGEISFLATQKIAELQFNVVSKQIDNVMEQLKFLDTWMAYDYLLSEQHGLADAIGARTVDGARKATTNPAVSNNETTAKIDKRYPTAKSSKIKFVKRKIRRK